MTFDVLDSQRASIDALCVHGGTAAADYLERGAPFFAVDREWRVTTVNRNHERLTGLGRAGTLGRRCWDAFPDIAVPHSPYRVELHRALREQVDVAFEAPLPSVGAWTSVAAHPARDGGLGIFVHDITARRATEQALRESKAFHSQILASVTDGVTVLDAEGDVRWMNVAWRRLLGIGEFAEGGCSWLDHWRGVDRARAELALATARVGGVGRFVGSLHTARGEVGGWDVVVAPVRAEGGAARSLLAVARAVTDWPDAAARLGALRDAPSGSSPEPSAWTTVAGQHPLRRITRIVTGRAIERPPAPGALATRPTELRRREADTERTYDLPLRWRRKLFLALCRRHGLTPYRRARQAPATVSVLATRRFLQTTLWPEYLALSGDLERHLAGVADRVIRAVIHDDVSEAEERDLPMGLPAA